MKRTRTLIAIIAVSLTAASCAVTKYNSGIPAMEVTPIALLQPLSYIEFMLKDHSMAISDSLSQISSSTLAEIVSNRIPVDCIIPVEYTEEMMAEVDVLPGLDPKTLFGATIPDKTRQLILDSGHRYGAIVFSRGFTREHGSYATDVAKGAIIGIATAILTMGALVGTMIPTKSISQVSIMIVDAETNRIVYYDRTPEQEYEPLNRRNLERQVNSIVKGFK